jgi:hypothetical protein
MLGGSQKRGENRLGFHVGSLVITRSHTLVANQAPLILINLRARLHETLPSFGSQP